MKSYAAVLVGLLCTTAAPAFAAWQHLGNVTFSMADSRDSADANFFGDRVALTSRLGDVYCQNVTAILGNGQTRSIFRGLLRSGYTKSIGLPDDVRHVRQLNFDCRPMDTTAPATVDVAANTPVGDFGEQRYG